jgi:hypothetical protein
MTQRERPPDRRSCETFNMATISRFADGQLSEVFISNSKSASHSAAIGRDCGILISLCCQFGCPPEVIAHALTRDSDGTAATVAGAVLDLLTGGDAP